MYRIMLADDEGIVLDSLKYIIENNFGAAVEVATAKNGRAVVELAEHFKPDIAFMDIQMPGISGIEAIRELKEINPSLIVVVLSAYDKFLYAQEAISLGVLEYLTKPVNQKVVVEVIRRAMDMIDTRRERRKNDLLIKEKLETVLPILESGFVSSILFQDHFREDVDTYRQLLELKEESGYMLALVFGENQQGNHMTNAVGTSVRTIENYRTVREILKEKIPCIVGAVLSNKIPVFIPCPEGKMDYNSRTALIDTCRELCRKLSDEIDVQFRIGIGSVRKLEQAMESYQEALKTLMNTTNRVAHVDDFVLNCQYEDDYPVELEKELFEKVKKGERDACRDAAGRFFDWMIDTYGENNSSVQVKTLEFVLHAECMAYDRGGMTYRFEDRSGYLAAICGVGKNSELRGWFLEKMTEACRNVAGKKEEHTTGLIERAREYIALHYMKDISLDDISRQMNLSSYYFSKLFKEETGENFIEYLTRVRITRAKELLQEKSRSMKEICAEVGYSDPNYFSRIFKKVTGVTPTEFRDRL